MDQNRTLERRWWPWNFINVWRNPQINPSKVRTNISKFSSSWRNRREDIISLKNAKASCHSSQSSSQRVAWHCHASPIFPAPHIQHSTAKHTVCSLSARFQKSLLRRGSSHACITAENTRHTAPPNDSGFVLSYSSCKISSFHAPPSSAPQEAPSTLYYGAYHAPMRRWSRAS